MRGAKVIGAYNSFHEAAAEGRRLFGSSNFSVQECIPGEDAYTVDMIIGMDIIALGKFCIENRKGNFVFSFIC